MLLDSLLRGVRGLRSRRRGAAGGRRGPSRAQGRLLRCEPLEERQLLSFDPGVSWATYLGGSALDLPFGMAVDGAGNTLVAGCTRSSDFEGAIPNSFHGGTWDAFVAKVKPDGSVAWVTYLGGSGDESCGLAYGGIALDGAGNVLVTGETSSSDFEGADANSFHGGTWDAFVAKVTSDGSLAWATYLGGSGDERGRGIAVDSAGNALVTGSTQSADFEGPNNPFGGNEDAFVAKLTPDGSLAWATYLGGSGSDAGGGIALDGAGNALVTGGTQSSDFAGANNPYHGGNNDAFVAKVSSIDGSVIWATYLGGSDWDGGGLGIAVDGAGNALVTGTTYSSDFAGADNSYHGGIQDAFVAKVTSDGSLAWATYLGGSGSEVGRGIAVDGAGNALVPGFTYSSDFAGANNPYHGNIYELDAFVAKVTSGGALAWATYLGGTGGDFGYAIALDGAGNALVTGNTSSTDFAGANNSKHGGTDGFVVKLNPAVYDATKFHVINDASQDQTYDYNSGGGLNGSYNLTSGNTAPRGVATTIAGDKTWVVDANHKVYVYDPSGVLLGSWTAGTLPGNAVVEDITVCGRDVWIVDARSDKVFRYTAAASRLSGSQNAASSFSLNRCDTNPKGMVTDGTSLWVVDDGTTDKVFKYTLGGCYLGSWTISTSGATSPTGLTIDPTGASQDIWIVDSGTDKVYRYANARGKTSGSQAAAATFALAAGNTNPQGIADPPPPGSIVPTDRRAASLTDAALAAYVQYQQELQLGESKDKQSSAIPAVDLALAQLAS
jgi:hypothetical protein